MTQPSADHGGQEILHRVAAMIADEKTLRERLAEGSIDAPTEHERLAVLERELDQCWDLLRQRRALAAAGHNPDDARVRPTGQVEGYLE